jgi:hypothetical protein
MFFLIVVISLFIVTAMKMTSRNNADTSAHADGIEALYLAESALERVRYRLVAGTSCISLGDTVDNVPYSFSRGNFEILSATQPTATTCSASVAGTVTVGNFATQRRITADFETLTPFEEIFPDSASFTSNWTTTFVQSQGTVTWFSGYYRARTNGGGSSNSRLQGYSRRNIPVISTGATGLDTLLSFDYTKFASNGVTSDRFELGIALYDTTAGVTTTLWFDASRASMGTSLTSIVNLPVTLPANRNYNQLRITFFFDEFGRRQMTAYVDNINIGYYWDLTSWKEVDL